MKQAIIRTGNKQYIVAEGDRVKVDKITSEVDTKVTFSDVLLTATDKTVTVGTPVVEKATVEAKVISQARHKKVVGVKMKSKKRNRKYFGHKQPYTEVEITGIKTK